MIEIFFKTFKDPPTLELVKRVRDLYLERVPDVRFLIPVLTGLNKVKQIQIPTVISFVSCRKFLDFFAARNNCSFT